MEEEGAKSVIISILLTCFNRKERTLECLRSIAKQKESENYTLSIYLVDNGSVDGTFDAVSKEFPNVNLISGQGDLYWNGGMRVAFVAAMKLPFDYCLWLNDDTNLFSDAIPRLLFMADLYPETIVVGSVCDFQSKAHTYGGLKMGGKLKPLNFISLKPEINISVECDTFNGNCVLIPSVVVEKIGNLSPEYTHSMGDFDYGLRAKELGYKSVIAPCYFGYCSRNPIKGCFDRNNNVIKRLKILHSPKGLPPLQWFIFVWRHVPLHLPFYILSLYLKVILIK